MGSLSEFISHRNLPFRLSLLVLFIIPFIFYYDFWLHFYFHFSGSIIEKIITGNWLIVVINIIIFLTFLIPLSFRRKINWKEYGLVTAFIVSLFVEMYGIPLTVYFMANSFTGSTVENPNIVYKFDFFGQNISFTIAMVYGTLLMVLGTVLVVLGWVTLYRHLKTGDGLVTKGIYAHSRHPQYFGFILVIIGWLIGWPTILTLVFAPILIYIYVRVCKVEERELEKDESYEEYRKKVPFFI